MEEKYNWKLEDIFKSMEEYEKAKTEIKVLSMCITQTN